MGKPAPLAYIPGADPDKDEERSVHEVYERIAPHFSQTRYKPWPLIESFLRRLPAHAFGLDSGAGNGKYIPIAKSVGAEMVAMDRSTGLLSIAKRHGGDCVRGDLCGRGWRNGVFDFAISIAAIHHLSTPSRRQLAVQALIAPLYLASEPPYSRCLIYVWAYEQGKNSKRRMGQASHGALLENGYEGQMDDVDSGGPREGAGGEEKVQDVLVPWVLQKPGESSKSKRQPSKEIPESRGQEEKAEVYHRYYHLFTAGELHSLVRDAATTEGFEVIENLPDLMKEAGGCPGRRKWLRIVAEGWEADNWWLEAEVGLS